MHPASTGCARSTEWRPCARAYVQSEANIGSFCEGVLRVILVPIIVFVRRVVLAELIDVRFIEYNPKQVFTDTACVSESVFHGVAGRATPLDNANVTIHERSRCPGIYERHERRQINQ